MREFQVPQFITVEDRVLGPLTVKQSLFLGLGVVLIVIYNFLFTRLLMVVLTIPTGLLCIALAFIKVNGRPFSNIFKSMLAYFLRPHVFIWKKDVRPAFPQTPYGPEPTQLKDAIQSIPKLSKSKLSDLAWSLDIKERGGAGNDQSEDDRL